MIDNGTQILLVDGSTNGWTIDLRDNALAFVVDPTGTFNGADRVDTLDTYILWNMPGTRGWGSTLSGEIAFDALYFAAKAAYPDPLQTIICNRREIILPGSLKSEIWYDAGNAQFPFAELPGAYVEHGIAAKWSIASSDISVFWLGLDLQGQGVVFRQRGYETKAISNYALGYAVRKCPVMVASAMLSDTHTSKTIMCFMCCIFPPGTKPGSLMIAFPTPLPRGIKSVGPDRMDYYTGIGGIALRIFMGS